MTDEEKKADEFARRVIREQLEQTRREQQAMDAYIWQMPYWTREPVIEFLQKGVFDGDTTHSVQ